MRRFMLGVGFTMAVLLPLKSNAQGISRPVIYNGQAYDPAGPTVFFNPNVMVRVGTFEGSPLYVDATIEPNSVVYVPIGGAELRPYELRRSGELEATEESRPPENPIEPRPVSTAGRLTTAVARPRAMRIESIPPPRANTGISIEFNGSRWYHAGAAVVYSPERFVPAGEYHGFPVYADRDGRTDRIYVTAVRGGPLVPYNK
jgi:hypothetical protein